MWNRILLVIYESNQLILMDTCKWLLKIQMWWAIFSYQKTNMVLNQIYTWLSYNHCVCVCVYICFMCLYVLVISDVARMTATVSQQLYMVIWLSVIYFDVLNAINMSSKKDLSDFNKGKLLWPEDRTVIQNYCIHPSTVWRVDTALNAF